jgi:hypothetical protein
MVHFMRALVSSLLPFFPRFPFVWLIPRLTLMDNVLREHVMYFLSGYILACSRDEPCYHLHIPVHANHHHQPKVITRVLPFPTSYSCCELRGRQDAVRFRLGVGGGFSDYCQCVMF